MKLQPHVRRIVYGTIRAYFPHSISFVDGTASWITADMTLPDCTEPDAWCDDRLGPSAGIASMPAYIDIRGAWIRYSSAYHFTDERHACAFKLVWG